MLRPLPVPEPERLFAIYETWKGRNGNVSGGNFTDAVAANTMFSEMTAIQYSSFNLSDTRRGRAGDRRPRDRVVLEALQRSA